VIRLNTGSLWVSDRVHIRALRQIILCTRKFEDLVVVHTVCRLVNSNQNELERIVNLKAGGGTIDSDCEIGKKNAYKMVPYAFFSLPKKCKESREVKMVADYTEQ